MPTTVGCVSKKKGNFNTHTNIDTADFGLETTTKIMIGKIVVEILRKLKNENEKI